MLKIFCQLKTPIGACDLYRSINPAKFLTPVLLDYGVQLLLERDFTLHPKLEAAIIQRHATDELLCYLMHMQHCGMRLAYDIDDDMLGIPNWSTACLSSVIRWEVVASRMAADRVWASTKSLKQVTDDFRGAKQSRSIVLPNLVDLSHWRGGFDHPGHEKDIRICWTGSPTHDKDLEVLTPVLDAIFAKYHHVGFCYFGDEVPSEWLRRWFDRITHFEWTHLNAYPRRLQFVSPHIGLCPLADDKFNYSKSAIKAFEYTLAGAAVVASPLPPYQVWRDPPIWKFASTTEQWIEAISELIEDHEQRRQMQGKALEVVARHFSWQQSDYRQLWLAAMLDLVGYKPGETKKAEEKPSGTSGVAEALKKMKGVA